MDNPNFVPDFVAAENKINENSRPSVSPALKRIDIESQQNENVSISKMEATIHSTTPLSTPENHPLSNFIKLIAHDPATTKLLITIISILSLYWILPTFRNVSEAFPFFVINAFSLIYIFITVIWMNHGKPEKCEGLKKVFGGRDIFWHDIHSTLALMLTMGNFSCVFIETNFLRLNLLFSLTNTMCFGYEFFLTTKTAKLYVTEESVPKWYCKIVKWFLGLFKRHPIKFNFLQLICFVAALIFYCRDSYDTRQYFIYCSFSAVFGSGIPVVFKLINKRCKWYFSNPKKQTYFSICTTIFTFLAVLTNAVDVQRVSVYNSDYDGYSGHYYDRYVNFPIVSPISFSISCIIFVLSLLDLYSQAIFNKTRSINELNDTMIGQNEQQKQSFCNLPQMIENPFENEGVKKVLEY